MKNLFYILLFICSVSFGQYRVTIQADNIPTSPESPEDTFDVWIDILQEEDFEDFAVTALHTATAPVGIPNDSLEANFAHFESLGSDSGNDPDIADNADIVLFDGSNVMKSWYVKDQCCTGSDTGIPGVTDGGTGIDIYSWINTDHSEETEVWVFWKEWHDADFENSDGYKQPGIINTKSSNQITSRLIINDYGGYEFNQGHYIYAWFDGDGTIRSTTNRYNVDGELGEWVYKATRTVSGTVGNWDGFTELYIDGIKVGSSNTSKPFLVTGSTGWIYFNVSTFMGGASVDYISPRTQWINYDMFIVGVPNEDAPFSGSTQAPANADITDLLEEIMDFPAD